MPRYFTVEEATALLPRLRPLVREVQELRRQADAAQSELDSLTPPAGGNGHARDPRALRLKAREANQLTRRLQRATQAVQDLGGELKDIEMGLVDFLALRNGREVYLCWNVDEIAVAFWHGLETGFRGRQPL